MPWEFTAASNNFLTIGDDNHGPERIQLFERLII